MPFDDRGFLKDDALTFSPGKEGLRKLAVLLRADMPENFRWDYSVPCDRRGACGTIGCAYGLAKTVWPELELHGIEMIGTLCKAFGLETYAAIEIFYCARTYGKEWRQVTPHDVANAIDRYLATGKVTP